MVHFTMRVVLLRDIKYLFIVLSSVRLSLSKLECGFNLCYQQF